MIIKKEIEIGGRIYSIETGKYAKQADAAVMVRYGDTMVLASVVANKEAKEGVDFLPLQVEYRERMGAAGKIPGGFLKREGRPSEKEVLSSRLIDRPIRPMFPESFRCETQVILTVFSADQENDSDLLGACGASAALMISDIPFNGPVAEVRVGRIDGSFVINPTFSQLEKSNMDVTVAGTSTSIVMVEGEAREISEEELLEALRFAHTFIRQICDLQTALAAECGRPKRVLPVNPLRQPIADLVSSLARERMREACHLPLKKEERANRSDAIRQMVFEQLPKERGFTALMSALAEGSVHTEEEVGGFLAAHKGLVEEALTNIEYEEMRQMILAEGRRLDGRGVSDIRTILCEVGLLPRAHGSALFTRGETQSLTTATLGTKMDEQILDGLLPETSKRFMLHYNFPPYSVGEVGRLFGTGRREIGHGNLAERSLKTMIPPETEFPYTVRIVSDILESNGSSSMATVCAGSLSLMDAGIPLIKPVAGIAMGLVKEGERVAILSDILGNEDFLGDMDFKVAGTRDGITGFQMDIKIQGISFEIFAKALEQARVGRQHILGVMNGTIDRPRPDISPYAPRLTTIKIPVDMIGAVIGPGGKMIRQITKETGTEIDISDDGTIVIASNNNEKSQAALDIINRITEVPEVGKVYKARVTRIMEFGAFMEFLPGKEGLVHISHLDINRVNQVTDVVNLGDELEVKLIEKDREGRYNLSRKALLPGYDPSKETPRADRGGHRRRDSRDGGHREGGGGDRHHRGGGGDEGHRRHR